MSVFSNINFIKVASDSLNLSNSSMWDQRISGWIDFLNENQTPPQVRQAINKVRQAWSSFQQNKNLENLKQFKKDIGALLKIRNEEMSISDPSIINEMAHLSRYPHLYMQRFLRISPHLADSFEVIWRLYASKEYVLDRIGFDPMTRTALLSFKEESSNFKIVIGLIDNQCSIDFFIGDQFTRAATLFDLQRLEQSFLRRTSCLHRIQTTLNLLSEQS